MAIQIALKTSNKLHLNIYIYDTSHMYPNNCLITIDIAAKKRVGKKIMIDLELYMTSKDFAYSCN